MIKMFKRQLSRTLRAIFFLIALAAVVLSLDSSLKLVQEDNICARYYRYPRDTFDVVFLGASLVLYGIYPMELYDEYGMASYSLSTGNQSLKASYLLAKEAIEKDHPKLIVLDCGRAKEDEEYLKPQYLHYITDTMPYWSINRFNMITELIEEGQDRKPFLFPLIAYHSRWQDFTFEDALPQTKEKVYGAKVASWTRKSSVSFKKASISQGVMTETSRNYIQKTIDLCRQNDTEILLITMPVMGDNQFFAQEGYNLRASAALEVEQLAKKNGVLFANYFEKAEKLGLDPVTESTDGEHLNRWGAGKFTKILGDFISSHYEIPDRRGTGGVYKKIEKDLDAYPVNRMKDSLQRSRFLRDYAAILCSDVAEKPVENALVLITLYGSVNGEILSAEDAGKLQRAGLRTNLHEWQGHGWVAVIDGGKIVYETGDPKKSEGGIAEDKPDEYSGKAGKLSYKVTSGTIDEETEIVHSSASIRVNGLEYVSGGRGLHFAVFDKSTGKLMDQCWINIHSRALDCNHDNH